jgi:hypothetical protein
MPRRAPARVTMLAVALSVVFAAPAAAQSVPVLAGTPGTPFSQNKQNEPAVAVDQNSPTVLAAGANDNIDMEACNAGADNDCPFTDGVGVSGIAFSFDSGHSWTQPTYSGFTARHCLGAVGPDPGCNAMPGPIGTLPNYYENGLVSDGDPALAFGPRPTAAGGFSYANGSRLYYANLTSAFPGQAPFRGAEAIAVSHTDNVAAAARGVNSAWSAPVIASRQSSAQFSDKEQIWADNATSSPFFGNVYVCYADFRGNGNGFTNQPLMMLTSRNGGGSWIQRQVTPAANNISGRNGFGRSGCTVRTDSHGVVYVFTFQFGFSATTAAAGQIQMIRSFDGGRTFERPRNIFTAFDTCNYFEASIARCVEDGVAGARSDLSPAPSVDIANGAPTGGDATNRIVLTWVDGRDGLNHEHVMFTSSSNGGATWSTPAAVERGTDRGYYSAPSISPNGSDVWLVYNAFLEPFKPSAEGPANDRPLAGVVLHATGTGAFSQVFRSERPGDARASSQNNLAAEFLGDYVYSAATRTYSMSVWNDVRDGADCPAIDEFRQELHEEAVATGQPTAEAEEPRGAGDRERDQGEDEPVAPPVQQVCPAGFGNSDIFGWSSGF